MSNQKKGIISAPMIDNLKTRFVSKPNIEKYNESKDIKRAFNVTAKKLLGKPKFSMLI